MPSGDIVQISRIHISNQKLDNILPGIYFWIVMGNKITTDRRYVVHSKEPHFVSKESTY